MSSSVSSERAFSQNGITINKQWNRLKGDIVEALQCIKCAIWHNLLFQEPAPLSTLKSEFNEDGEDDEDGGEGSKNAEGWDDLLMDSEDDSEESGMDTDSDVN